MLKANKAVTHELMWNRGVEAMYRVHPQPSPDEWDEALVEIQELDGVSIPGDAWDDPRKAVNATLEQAPGRQLDKIQWAVMKVMPRAKYMNDPFGGHHALNFEIYGHFTSPIRRLSDLINTGSSTPTTCPRTSSRCVTAPATARRTPSSASASTRTSCRRSVWTRQRSTTAVSKSSRILMTMARMKTLKPMPPTQPLKSNG